MVSVDTKLALNDKLKPLYACSQPTAEKYFDIKVAVILLMLKRIIQHPFLIFALYVRIIISVDTPGMPLSNFTLLYYGEVFNC